MKKVRLNGMFMGSREKAHAHIKKRMGFPDYYGGNLDALMDCLTEIGETTEITIVCAERFKKKLGDYGTKLLSVLAAATGENPRLTIVIFDGLFR